MCLNFNIKIGLLILLSTFVFGSCIGLMPVSKQLPVPEPKTQFKALTYNTVKPFRGVACKRAAIKGIRFIALTFINNSDTAIIINENHFDVFADLQNTQWLNKNKCYRKLNNTYGLPLLLYIAGHLTTYETEYKYDDYGNQIGKLRYNENNTYTSILYGTALLGIATIIYGNINLYRELNKNYLYGKTVLPGETLTGYIAIKAALGSEILMRVKQ